MTLLLRLFRTSAVIGFIFSLLSVEAFSQTTHLHLLVNAVNTNFNYGKSNSSLRPYKKNTTGLQLGATFQAGISPAFSVVTEAYFMMKGGTLKAGNPLTVNKSTLRVYTAELPVLARLHIGRVYFNSGPYVSYTFEGRIKTEGSASMAEKSANLSFDNSADGFKRWEMGIQAGAGYVFDLKKASLALDVRYGYGLTNLSQDVERYNRMLNISVLVFRNWKRNPFFKNQQ